MPPRYAYWTILAGGLPTAFRSAEREDLLPTFKRILEKHPDAEMKYFARGRIWDSPEAARAAKEEQSRGRGREWRPGGEHRDPRQPFKDAKKARNQERRQERFDRKNRPDWRSKERPPRENRPAWRPKDGPPREKTPREKPHGDPLRRPARPRSFDRPRFPRAQGSGDQWPPRPPRPDREPRPEREPRREREPRPDRERRPHEPATPPSGPPERGRPFKPRPRPHGPRPKGPQGAHGPKGPKGPKRRS